MGIPARAGKTWRSREIESNFQGGKTGGDEKGTCPKAGPKAHNLLGRSLSLCR